MMLPACSPGYHSQWACLSPTVDCALGMLSPELIDEDFGPNQSIPRVTEGDVISICCSLDLELFRDGISDEKGSHWTWTAAQRRKAECCNVLNTVDELSTWVSGLNILLSFVLTICCG